MLNNSKLNSSIPCHLTSSYASAVKGFAADEDLKPSQWVRRLIVAEVNRKILQAQATLEVAGSLANESLDANEFEDFDDE